VGQKVLIITSSGGGGLLQAAKAKEQEILAQDPDAIILWRDVMKDWIWERFGRFTVNLWNGAQLKGSVRAQSFFGMVAPIADYLFWISIFFYSLRTIFQEEVDRVIDTQVLGTSAVLKVLRLFHRYRQKKVVLEKVLVDLPTKKATHFFKPIRKLCAKDRAFFRLITIPPLLEKGETNQEFWKHHCNLSESHLQYEDYYVRRSFAAYRNLPRGKDPFPIKTRFQTAEELELIRKCVSRSGVTYEIEENEIRFCIDSRAFVFTILLGSQPANSATLRYVQHCLEIFPLERVFLFVFCSQHEQGQKSLFCKVTEAVQKFEPYPKNLTIVPMSFQSDDVIASLFFRSDMTCTRSGGQTAMELMSVSKGEIWIHSEAKAKAAPLTQEELLAGIPGWESANAAYLQHARNAKLVTPDTFGQEMRALFSTR
jgi:hypothetical protein